MKRGEVRWMIDIAKGIGYTSDLDTLQRKLKDVFQAFEKIDPLDLTPNGRTEFPAIQKHLKAIANGTINENDARGFAGQLSNFLERATAPESPQDWLEDARATLQGMRGLRAEVI